MTHKKELCFKPSGAVAALATCGALIVAIASQPAFGQALEEVVVTAMKRDSSLQDIPISMSALGGDMLANIGADDFLDYADKVPGFNLVDNGPGSRRLVIRGVQGSGEAQVGLYYDEIPVTGAPGAGSNAGQRQPDIKLFDIERVEILRGPQGTLYGAGTMGGTLRVITRKPDASGFAATLSADISSTHKGGLGTQLNGMINVPLIEDKLAVRVVAYDRDIDGFIDNVTYDENNVNNEDTRGGRVAVRWTPTDNFILDGLFIKQNTETGGNWAYQKNIGDLKSAEPVRTPFVDDTTMASLTSDLDLGWANWVVSFSQYDRDVEYSFSESGHYAPPNDLLLLQQPQPLEMHSFETRLASQSDGPFNWIMGFFSSTRDATLDSQDVRADGNGYVTLPIEKIFFREDLTTLSQQAIFGEVYYEFTDQLTLTLGARYFDYEYKKLDTLIIPFLEPPIENPTTRVSKFDEDGSIFKVNLAYQLNDDILLYGQVSEGFRPGGANQQIPDQPIPRGYEADTVTNYEIGMRSTWLDGNMILNGSIYHLVWDNIQVSQSTPDLFYGYLGNAGEAQIDGIELELSLVPVDNLDLGATFNFVDARLTEDQPAVNSRAALKGDKIPVVPELTASVSAQYTWFLDGGLELYARGDFSYTDSTTNNYRDFLIDADPQSPTYGEETTIPNNRYAVMDAYALGNLRFGITTANDWGAALYVTNVADKRGATYIQVDYFRPPPGNTYVVRPRTVGLSVYKNF